MLVGRLERDSTLVRTQQFYRSITPGTNALKQIDDVLLWG